MARQASKSSLLFSGSDWDFETLSRAYDAIEDDRGSKSFIWTPIPMQMEIISSEQMLDAYSSVGMPLMYRHWSFGKHFLYEDQLYRKGRRGLAYELVINSNPCIVYLMEENTMALQALVTAHAALRAQSFLQEQPPVPTVDRCRRPSSSYMDFAKGYITRCEERHGIAAVERILNSAHALMEQGVFSYRRPPRLSSEKEREGHSRAAGIRGAFLQRSVADAAADRKGKRPDDSGPGRRSGRSRSICPKRTCSISWKRTAWSWSPGSERSSASCASSPSISIRSGRPR